ncbi:MAG: hypothetical protein ABEJ96_10235, partial [Thiohalorhabdaceae bacterium]
INRYWYAVYPSGKKLSIIAQYFLDFMVEEGARVAEQMDELRAALPSAPLTSRPAETAPDSSTAEGTPEQ